MQNDTNIWLKIQKYTGMLSNGDSFLFIHFLEISLLRRGCNIIRIKKKGKLEEVIYTKKLTVTRLSYMAHKPLV